MSKCRDCLVPITFVRISNTGRVLPVDPAPDEDGNVFARMVGGSLAGHVRTKDEHLPAGWSVFMPHHATCQIASRGRKRALGPSKAPTLPGL